MVKAEEAIDEAEYVRSIRVPGAAVVWVWHGGVTINEYTVFDCEAHDWKPSGVMTVQDEKGRPVEQDEIEKHIETDVQRVREEGAGEEL